MSNWDTKKIEEIKKYLIEDNQRAYPHHIPWQGDKLVSFDVYKVPITLLSFNFNNTRIRADLEAYLQKNKENINPNDRKQQNEVQRILLSSDFIGEEETRLLKSDLRKRGQLDPAVATPDGVLIDGNRRLAIFRKLVSELDVMKFTEMDICVLPATATPNDLKELEMRLQMSHTFRVAYGPINTALEFRNLYDEFKWNYEKIEKITGGQYKTHQIQRMILVIDLIDEYLKQLPPKGTNVKQYKLAENGWEIFDNLFALLKWSKENSSMKKTELRQRLGFQLIAHEHSTYTDIRKYARIIKDKDLNRKLESVSDTLSGKNPTAYLNPLLVEREWISFQQLKASYKESQEDPKKIADQALRKLLTIQPKKIKKRDTKLEQILAEIIRIVNELKKLSR